MRAILLAAGLGTRLRPITDVVPKCLVPINGQPLLDIWLSRLTQAGVGPFLINTHYLARQVENYVAASSYKDHVQLVNEPHLLGTAGTLISNLEFFQEEDGLLIHADNYCLADFIDFQRAHANRPSDCLITMLTFRTTDPQSCGIVEVNASGVVVGFYEKVKNPPGNLANGAIYILSPELLAELSLESNVLTDFSTEVVPRYIGRIYTYETAAVFLDIGTPKTYTQANNSLVV